MEKPVENVENYCRADVSTFSALFLCKLHFLYGSQLLFFRHRNYLKYLPVSEKNCTKTVNFSFKSFVFVHFGKMIGESDFFENRCNFLVNKNFPVENSW